MWHDGLQLGSKRLSNRVEDFSLTLSKAIASMLINRFHRAFLSVLIALCSCHASAPSTTRHPWVGNVATTTKETIDNTAQNATTSSIPSWKRVLPPPLDTRKTLNRIIIPLSPTTHATVYLLGTSHVSNDSSADVRLLLQSLKPEVVFLELCDQRTPMLNPKPLAAFDTNLTFWQKVQQIQTSSGMTKGSAIGTLLLTQVQDDYAESLGVELGGEFKMAWEYCLVQKPIVILGDRPLQITLVRAWESLSWFGKIKVLAGLLWSSVQKPNPNELREWMQKILQDGETDVLTESMAELRKSFPSLERVILKERDAYLACKLYQTCRYLEKSRDHVIVAIVGAGHTPGICDWLTNGNGQTPEEVLRERLQTKKWEGQDMEALVQEVTQLPVQNNVLL
jgi:pheromone shutdown protein TraB